MQCFQSIRLFKRHLAEKNLLHAREGKKMKIFDLNKKISITKDKKAKEKFFKKTGYLIALITLAGNKHVLGRNKEKLKKFLGL